MIIATNIDEITDLFHFVLKEQNLHRFRLIWKMSVYFTVIYIHKYHLKAFYNHNFYCIMDIDIYPLSQINLQDVGSFCINLNGYQIKLLTFIETSVLILSNVKWKENIGSLTVKRNQVFHFDSLERKFVKQT